MTISVLQGGIILAGLATLLGAPGVARHQADAERIVRAGKAAPLIVLLAERWDGSVTWLSATVEVAPDARQAVAALA